VFPLSHSKATCDPSARVISLAHYSIYHKASLSQFSSCWSLWAIFRNQPLGSNIVSSREQKGVPGPQSQKLAGRVVAREQQLVLQFFVHKDLFGKVRVHDFMVVVRDFIVGFTTLLSMDTKLCSSRIQLWTQHYHFMCKKGFFGRNKVVDWILASF
jgi:hypothetical protein